MILMSFGWLMMNVEWVMNSTKLSNSRRSRRNIEIRGGNSYSWILLIPRRPRNVYSLIDGYSRCRPVAECMNAAWNQKRTMMRTSWWRELRHSCVAAIMNLIYVHILIFIVIIVVICRASSKSGNLPAYLFILKHVQIDCSYCSVRLLRPPRTLCNAQRLSVCLSVYLLITLRTNYWTHLPGRKNCLNFRSHPPRIRIHEFFEEFFNIAR